MLYQFLIYLRVASVLGFFLFHVATASARYMGARVSAAPIELSRFRVSLMNPSNPRTFPFGFAGPGVGRAAALNRCILAHS